MERTKNAVRNIRGGVIEKIITIILGFITRTVLIKVLGSEYLGLNSLYSSILQVLNFAELGFGSAIVFSMYKPIANNDKKTICALMNLYKKVYRIVGIVIAVIGLAIVPFLENIIKGTPPSDINIYVLYLIYLFGTVSSYWLFAYKNVLINAHQRNDIGSNLNSIINIIKSIVQIVFVILAKNYYLFVIMIPIASITGNIICAGIVDKKYPEYKPEGKLSKEEIRDIKKRVYGLMTQKICGTTRNSFDSIFLSAFNGLSTVGIYNNYYSIMSYVQVFLSIITSSITASVGNSIATESVEKNYNDMMKFNFMYMWISGWCTVCMLCLYQPFVKIWMGTDYMFPFYIVIFLCIYFYMLRAGDIRYTYMSAAGIWWEGKSKYVIETILNISLNYFLGKYFGVGGIILATVISLFLVNFLLITGILYKNYFKRYSQKEFFINHLIYALTTILACGVTYYCCSWLQVEGFIGILIKAVICCIVPNIIYVIFYRKNKNYDATIAFVKNIVKSRANIGR